MPPSVRPKPPAKPAPVPAAPPTPLIWLAGLAGVLAILLLFLAVSFEPFLFCRKASRLRHSTGFATNPCLRRGWA